MLLIRSLLVGVLFSTTNSEDDLIQLTPNTLNQARFLKLQRIPLRRLPTRQERRKPAGAPVLICGEGAMGIVVNHPFNGRIFASHREKDPECMQYVTTNTLPRFMTSLEGNCGVWSRKSLQPSTTDFHLRVVVSFNYEHLTEEDKIYDLTCSYSSMNISIGAYYDTVNFVAQPVVNSSHSPVCHYSLRKNTLDGPRTQSATIGQLVYHRWSCPSTDFAFKVYRCYVHNGLQQSYLIINDSGFTKTRRVHFNCMLSVCHKNDADCMKDIPPRCSRSLRKRQLPGDISVEERLKRLHALMQGQNYTGDDRFDGSDNVVVDGEAGAVTAKIAARPLVVDDGPESPSYACKPSAYLHWIYVLLITNILSILVAVLACSNLLKRRFSMDVTIFEDKCRSSM